MDLGLYLRVLWRFRLLVAVGLLGAAALSLLSYATLSFDAGRPVLHYRDGQTWGSQASLLITQHGFPWGRATQGYAAANPETGTPPVPIGDSARLANLSMLYTQLLNGDDVRRIALEEGPLPGTFSASPVSPANNPNVVLPLISVSGISDTPRGAVEATQRGTSAFLKYLDREQDQAQIPAPQRVVVQVLAQPRGAGLVEPRKKTLPIVVFLTVLTALVGLAFVLENLRPRVSRAPAGDRDRDVRISA